MDFITQVITLDYIMGILTGVAGTALVWAIRTPYEEYRPSSEEERDEHEEMANAERLTEYLERTVREGKEQ